MGAQETRWRAVLLAADDTEALGAACASGVGDGKWDAADADARDAYRDMGEAVATYILDVGRAALTDAQPVFTLEEVEKAAETVAQEQQRTPLEWEPDQWVRELIAALRR